MSGSIYTSLSSPWTLAIYLCKRFFNSKLKLNQSQMDIQRLYEASRCGNVEVLRKSLQQNPLILTEVVLTTSNNEDTLLHVATKAGQLSFVRELLEQMPDLAQELNKDGYRPMDITAIVGNVEIVAELNKKNCKTCRLKGKDGRTPLHHATIHGRVEVINELVSKSPESLEDVTAYNETVLHLAVKNHQVDAFGVLVQSLKSFNREKVINWCATNGNTVLHLAVSRKQKELLLGNFGSLEVNAINSKGLTAMDVLDIVMEDANDVQLRKILEHAGAKGAQEFSTTKPASTSNEAEEKDLTQQEEHSTDSFESVLEYFKYKKHRDSAGDARNVLLVVAGLIVSVTFQAGLQLPTGLQQTYSNSTSSNSSDPAVATFKNSYSSTHAPTTSLAPSEYYNNPAIIGVGLSGVGSSQSPISKVTVFLLGNSLALSWGILIIQYLTEGFPFRRELVGSMYALMLTYGYAVGSNNKPATGLKFALLIASLALPNIIRFVPFYGRKLINKLKKSSSATQAPLPLPISRG